MVNVQQISDEDVKMYMLLAGYGPPLNPVSDFSNQRLIKGILYWRINIGGIHSIVIQRKSVTVYFTFTQQELNGDDLPYKTFPRNALPEVILEYL